MIEFLVLFMAFLVRDAVWGAGEWVPRVWAAEEKPSESAWLIVQKSRFEEQEFRVELFLHPGFVRVNMEGVRPKPVRGPGVNKTEIWDLTRGRIANVDHARKMYYYTPIHDDRDQIIGEFGGRFAVFNLKAKGTTRKVGAYTCSDYSVLVEGEAFGSACYSKGLPTPMLDLYRKIGQKIEKFRGPSVINQVDLRAEGFLLSYVDEDEAVTEVDSIERVSVSPDRFRVPEEYAEREMERSEPMTESEEEHEAE